MSTKLIAGAVIVIGALGATVPFHLSGQYAQDALDANMQQYLDIEPCYIELVDTDRKGEGLYASTIDYTFKLKMPEEIMAKMDDEAKANFEKMRFRGQPQTQARLFERLTSTPTSVAKWLRWSKNRSAAPT